MELVGHVEDQFILGRKFRQFTVRFQEMEYLPEADFKPYGALRLAIRDVQAIARRDCLQRQAKDPRRKWRRNRTRSRVAQA